MVIFEFYADFVQAKVADPVKIAKRISPHTANIIHHSCGICNEAGELMENVKAHFAYGKRLDTENMVEELGDLMFYITAICNALGITLEDVITASQEKLSERYKDGFTESEARKRRDKQL